MVTIDGSTTADTGRSTAITFCLGLRQDSKVDIDAAASADSVGGAINTTPDDLPTTSTSSCMPLKFGVCFFAVEVGFIMVQRGQQQLSSHGLMCRAIPALDFSSTHVRLAI